MIRLTTVNQKLQLVLSGAITSNQLPVSVAYSDKTTAAYTGGIQLANSNSTTAVDICSAPGASTIRDIDGITVQNADTVSATVTVRFNDNGTTYTIFKALLATGDQLNYTHGQGWKTINSSGALIGIGPTGSTGASGASATSVPYFANLCGGL